LFGNVYNLRPGAVSAGAIVALACVREESGVRRLGTILAFGTLACACLFGQTKTTVPGMSRFTDAGFGFSFCYPAIWKVMDEPVADPTRNGWFPDAKIVKELAIRNPAAWDNEDQLPGVMIQELLAPRGLTELGRSKSASPVGVDQKIFFDSRTRRWMFETLTESPDGTPPATSPAEIARRTIGGLPIFWGATRGGAEVIVPLDGFHFLAISSLVDPGNYDSHTYLAATVVATDPGAGRRASEQAQAEAIRREGVKLGVVGESLGYWYKDGQHVYDFQGDVIPRADPQTFTPWSPTGPTGFYARDRMHVYDRNGAVIPGADPKTFVATGVSTAEDAHHTYDWSSGSLKISNVSPHE
jgi:hypothetical protein